MSRPRQVEYHPRIRDLPLKERPRERLREYGSGALSNAELLAIILRTGGVSENVLNLAERLLATRGQVGARSSSKSRRSTSRAERIVKRCGRSWKRRYAERTTNAPLARLAKTAEPLARRSRLQASATIAATIVTCATRRPWKPQPSSTAWSASALNQAAGAGGPSAVWSKGAEASQGPSVQ